MKAAIVLKDAYFKDFNKDEFDTIIGADKGALALVLNHIVPDIAIGDFDSVTPMEFIVIEKSAKKLIKLNPIKDETDTHEAIELVKDYDEIRIFGGIKGKRIEHFIANLIDIINYDNVSIIDKESYIETIKGNDYKVKTGYKYVSFFSITDEAIITLDGFKYPLVDFTLKKNNPLGVSNEIISTPSVNVKKGKVLVIYTKSDEEV